MKGLKLLLLAANAFFLFGFGGNTVHMAIKPMTEQYILGSMAKKLIEAETDLKVDVSSGIGGGTSNILPAMQKGEFDFYPEYTGTGWNIILKKDGIYKENLFDELQQGSNALGLTWLGMTGFNNTFGIGARKEIADRYKLAKISDLAPVADKLVFGGEYDFFERQDGYKALCDKYGLKFRDTRDMDIGLKYSALNQGQIDIMNIFTTDGQLAGADIVILEDDKGLYPSYACGFVARSESLKKFPALQEALAKFTNLITDREMAEMNRQVETEGKEPEEVAEAFLKRKGILK